MSTPIKKYKDILIERYGQGLLSGGYTSLPNNLIFYRRRLGLTRKELELIQTVFILNSRGIVKIKDKQLNVDSEFGVEYYRQRKSLKAKGYLEYKVARYTKGEGENKTVHTLGIIYDFTGLKKTFEEILKEQIASKEVAEGFKDVSINDEQNTTDIIDDVKDDVQIAKTKTDDAVGVSLDEEQKFLLDFAKLYSEVLNEEIDYRQRKKYKEFLLIAFRKRSRGFEESLSDIYASLKNAFIGIDNNRKKYVLQDIVSNALLMPSLSKIKNKKNEVKKIPGADYLLAQINKAEHNLTPIENGV